MQSNFGTLNWSDLIKGVLIASGTVILTAVLASLQATPPAIPATWAQWSGILTAGAIAGITYLLKNIFSNSDGKLGTEAK
jgi:hypothetical protein